MRPRRPPGSRTAARRRPRASGRGRASGSRCRAGSPRGRRRRATARRRRGCRRTAKSSGIVSSTRLVLLCRNVNSRTRSPTETASSTRADMMRGVDTDTSTPHDSLNSHSLLGWLTRPTVRGTANSVLASSEMTRLALSSPVEAMTTSHVSSCASSSEDSSQASASSHWASGTRSARIDAGSLSISSTAWPLSMSSGRRSVRRRLLRRWRRASVAPPVRRRARRARSARRASSTHEEAQVVAFLDDRVGRGDEPVPEPGQEGDADAGCRPRARRSAADPVGRRVDLVEADLAGRVAPRGLGAGRKQPAEHLVGGPGDRGDRGYAEPFVDLGAARVVDAGDDVVDAELLARDTRGDDVGVVAAGDRRERVGVLDAGLPRGRRGRSPCR